MKKLEIHGLVALVLSVGLVTAVIILAIETILHPGAITAEESTVLSTVLGGLIGSVATYMGVRHTTNNGVNGAEEPAE